MGSHLVRSPWVPWVRLGVFKVCLPGVFNRAFGILSDAEKP